MATRGIVLSAMFMMVGALAMRAQDNGQAAAEKYIKLSESQWAEAEVNRNYKVAQQILAEDFAGVAPDGSHYGKTDEIARTSKPDTEFLSNKVTEVSVRFYGDAAVAQGTENWAKRNGEKGSYVWTDTWVLRKNLWQIVAAEDVEVLQAKK
jgi:hypothetical protein